MIPNELGLRIAMSPAFAKRIVEELLDKNTKGFRIARKYRGLQVKELIWYCRHRQSTFNYWKKVIKRMQAYYIQEGDVVLPKGIWEARINAVSYQPSLKFITD